MTTKTKVRPVYEFVILGKLPGLNEYTQAQRNSKYGGNKAKREAEAHIMKYLPPPIDREIDYPVWLQIDWYEPSNRRDADNVGFSLKFIQDAMVKAGLLANDSRRYIKGWTPRIHTDKDNPRIEVAVVEMR